MLPVRDCIIHDVMTWKLRRYDVWFNQVEKICFDAETPVLSCNDSRVLALKKLSLCADTARKEHTVMALRRL